MPHVALCDDLRDARFALRCALEKIFENRAIEAEFFEFTAGESLIRWFEKNAGKIDLLFLDIEMGGLTGMETAAELRKQDHNLQIVFVTGHPDYVFDGYAVNALGYLMKPADPAKLNDILTRALAALHKSAPQDFVIKNAEGTFRVPKSAIRYFASDKRTVICSARNRDYVFYARLDDVARKIGPPFVRIHQRYLVNGDAAERVASDGVFINGKSLPISRVYQKEAVLALTRVMLS